MNPNPGSPDRAVASRSAIAVIVAGVLFGTTGTAQTFAPAGAEPLSVGTTRLVLAGVLLGLIGLVQRVRLVGWTLPRWSVAAIWVVVAAVGMTAYQATFFAGTRANGVAVGAVVALGSSPLFAGLFEWLCFRRRPTANWAVATALAVTGVVLLADLVGTDIGTDPGGLAASLTAGASYACYTVATKVLLERGWRSTAAVGTVFAVAAGLALPLLLVTDTRWIAEPTGLAVAVWLGVVVTVLPYLLVGAGLRALPAAIVVTLTLAEPATATGLGVLLLGEPLGWTQGLGILAVAAGVVVAGLAPGREASREPPV